MNQDDAFLQAILSEPGMAVHRLVYADWLEERGDSRAEYFRVEHAIAEAKARGANYPELWERWMDLRCTFEPEWMDSIPRLFTPSLRELVDEFSVMGGKHSFHLKDGTYLEGRISDVKETHFVYLGSGPLASPEDWKIALEVIDLSSLTYGNEARRCCVAVQWSEEARHWVHVSFDPRKPRPRVETSPRRERPWWKFW